MIIVRDVFNIRPDQMKEAKALLHQVKELNTRLGIPLGKVMTDLTGSFYTLVLETDYPSLTEYEKALPKVFENQDWQTVYGKFRPMIQSGQREIFSVVE